MFKRVFFLNMLLSALAILPNMQAQAADVAVEGKVITSSCTVSLPLVSGQQVNLGTLLGRTQFQLPGKTGDWESFNLNLTNCPPGTSKATVTFTGTPDGTNATLFANTEPAATAAPNMAVQMALNADRNQVLSNGDSMTVNINTTNNTATFPLAARLYTPLGGVQAGKVSSSVLVNFTYQ